MRSSPRGTVLAAPLAWAALGTTTVAVGPSAAASAPATTTAATATTATTTAHAAPAVGRPQPAGIATVVRADQACLTALAAPDRTLLALRFGSPGNAGVSASAAAAQLHVSPATFQVAELRAVRRLERARRAGHCTAAPPIAAVAVKSYLVGRAPPPSATATSQGLSWTSPTELALLGLIALSCGALVYGLRRDFGPPRANRGPGLRRRRRDR